MRTTQSTADPWAAVFAVAQILRAQGIPTRLDGDNITTARAAACELLLAFGVTPVPITDDDEGE